MIQERIEMVLEFLAIFYKTIAILCRIENSDDQKYDRYVSRNLDIAMNLISDDMLLSEESRKQFLPQT